MKRALYFIIAVLCAVSLLAGCAKEQEIFAEPIATEDETSGESGVSLEDSEFPEVGEPEPIEDEEGEVEQGQPAEPPYDLSPLELLGGYFINENGDMFLKLKSYTIISPEEDGFPRIEMIYGEHNPDLFKEYFFGTWHYYFKFLLTTGDIEYVDITFSDTSNVNNYFVTQVGNGIFTDRVNGGLHEIFWLDINQPDTMYTMSSLSYFDEGLLFGNVENIGNAHNNPYRIMKKVDVFEDETHITE